MARLLRLRSIFYSAYEKRLAASIKHMVGSKPFNLNLYKLALRHVSVADETHNGLKISNERLEYLGDAILGAIVAEFLFIKYPFRDEGFLTETRSKLVNREALNQIGRKLGLADLIEKEFKGKGLHSYKSLYGDVLEAMVGAVYLDRGFDFCKKFVLKRIIIHFDLDGIIKTTSNFKSKIFEWAQKENIEVNFLTVDVKNSSRFKEFVVDLLVNNEVVATGKGATKKKAEQDAAKTACETLQITV